MDALCKITALGNKTKPVYEIPVPDYDIQDTEEVLRNRYSANMDTAENGKYDSCDTSVSPEHVRKMMSKEQKDLQKDLKIMQRRGLDLQAKRPEFKAKHHEIKSKGIQRKESKDVEESELNTKLKSRSDVIKQAEEAQKIEDEKPEFMKVLLKKGKGSPKI